MKKLGSRLTAVLSLVLVFSMVLGSTNKAFASVDNHGFNDYKTKVDSDSKKYSDDEAAVEVAEVLPQTGTASVVIFYTLGAGFIALGGVAAHLARKEDEKNEAQR